MPSFATVTNGATVQAQDIDQLVNALSGAAGQGVPIAITGPNDSVNFALAVKNNEATNSRALQVLRANNAVLIQADANGVVVSPDGVVATAQVVNLSMAQTLTNKTFTSPTLNSPTLVTPTVGTGPLNMPAQAGGVAKTIAWGEGGAGLTSILGNTVGGSPTTCVLRFDIANGSSGGSATALTLRGDGAAVIPSIVGPTLISGQLNHTGTSLGVFNHSAGTQPTVTGSRGANAALASLLTGLASLGIVVDSSS